MECGNVPPSVRPPEPNRAVGPARRDPLPVRAVRRCNSFPRVVIVRRLNLVARQGVPLAHRPVRRGCHKAGAVRTERHAQNFTGVSAALGDHRSSGGIPYACHVVFFGGNDPRAVRTEGNVPDGISPCERRSRAVWFPEPASCSVMNTLCASTHAAANRDPSGLTATREGSVSGGPCRRIRTCPCSSSRVTASPARVTCLSPWRVGRTGCTHSLSGLKDRARSRRPSRSVRRKPVRVMVSMRNPSEVWSRNRRLSGGRPEHG